MQEMQVQCLVWELRSCMPCGTVKKMFKKKYGVGLADYTKQMQTNSKNKQKKHQFNLTYDRVK